MSLTVRKYIGVFLGYSIFYGLYFSPVLVKGLLLAPGDGFIFYVPALQRPWTIWSDLILGGYPTFADPQFLTWYPLRLLGFDYNLFVISAYVIASFNTFALVHALTRSFSAGVVAGLVYGGSGFMMAHLGHATIIHTAAWLPLIFWAMIRLYEQPTVLYWIIGVFAVSLAFLAGHPQVLVYALFGAGAFGALHVISLWRRSKKAFARLAFAYLLFVVAGFALGAIQLLPTAEMAKLSVRSKLTFAEFSVGSFPPDHWQILLFPNVLGTHDPRHLPYFGTATYGLTENACYFGIATLFLAALAWQHRGMRRQVVFWTIICVVSILYALGHRTPFGKLVFHIPGLNLFKVPARDILFLDLGMAVLAGIGLAAVTGGQVSRRAFSTTVSLFVAVLAAAIAALYWNYETTAHWAQGYGILLASPFRNPQVLIPIMFAAAGIVATWNLRARNTVQSMAFVAAVVALDLASFGWFFAWQLDPGNPATIAATGTIWESVRGELDREGSRILTLAGGDRPFHPSTPNFNLLNGLKSAGGYGPLIPRHYADATGMNPNGSIDLPANSPVVDLLAVRWLLTHYEEVGSLRFGNCGGPPERGPLRAIVPQGIKATHIKIISLLTCSLSIKQDATTLEVGILADGAVQRAIPIRAGRDTSEWSIDFPASAIGVQHQKAVVQRSFQTGSGTGHAYVATVPIGAANERITPRELSLSWLPSVGGIIINELALVDQVTGAETKMSFSQLKFSDPAQWSKPIPIGGSSSLIRYLRPAQLAWLVREVRHADPTVGAAIVRQGQFMDGSPFDSATMALVEESVPKVQPLLHGIGQVIVERQKPGHWAINVTSPVDSFLAISQTAYPGWRAVANGVPVHLFRTNHAFQGVAVAAGQTRIELIFSSRTLNYGAVLSGFTLAILAVLLAWEVRGKGRRQRSSRVSKFA